MTERDVISDLVTALRLCMNTGDLPWWVRSQGAEALRSAERITGGNRK